MYKQAKEMFAQIGIDTEAAIFALDSIPISLQCWQGDDVRGFENLDGYKGKNGTAIKNPGRAKNVEDLRKMLDKSLKLIPGAAKVTLHAMYGDVENISRAEIEPCHFKSWVDWARARGVGLNIYPTMFAHPNAASGLTLSHPEKGIREFWIEHVRRCRRIAAFFGLGLGQLSVMNLWIPDGYKDIPADQLTPRRRLEDSLDEIFHDYFDPTCIQDSVESTLFSPGAEGYMVGSYEFYFGYALKNGLALCLDSGHFNPSDSVSSKIASVALYIPKILLHVARPMRWDNNHVVLLDDELLSTTREITRHGLADRVHIGLDYFDNSIDRVTAWAIGARNMRKALLIALLEPYRMLQRAEEKFDFTQRLLIMEEIKTLPWQAVWDEYCERKDVPKRLRI